MSVGKGSTVLL